MFDTEREDHLALQQYKADLERSKMQLRQNSTTESRVSIQDFQDRGRGRPSEQDHGSTERARKGSNGDNARVRKISCNQESVSRSQRGLVDDDADEMSRTAGSSLTNSYCQLPICDLATEKSLSQESPNSPQTRIVRTDKPSTVSATTQAPTFAPQTLIISDAPGHFMHHRDTFAITKAKRSSGNKRHLTVLPRRIVDSLVKYIDRPTSLSLRLVSWSWNQAIDHVKPLQFPAIYRLPVDIVQQIYLFIFLGGIMQPSYAIPSIIDFNNARHTCRAWMAASLDKGILALAWCQVGRNSSCYMVEAGVQDLVENDEDDEDDEDNEDDPAVLWEWSLQLAKYCNSWSSSRW